MQFHGLLADLFLKLDAISMTIAVQDDLSSEVDNQVCACANVLFATLTNDTAFDETMTTVLEQMVAQFIPPTPPTITA